MPGDSQKPVAERRIALKLIQALPSGEKNFLDQVVNQISSWHQTPPDIVVDGIRMERHPLRRGLSIFAQYRGSQLFVRMETGLSRGLPRFGSLGFRRGHRLISRSEAGFPPCFQRHGSTTLSRVADGKRRAPRHRSVCALLVIRQVEELLMERGLEVTIRRFGRGLSAKCRNWRKGLDRYLKPTNISWRAAVLIVMPATLAALGTANWSPLGVQVQAEPET